MIVNRTRPPWGQNRLVENKYTIQLKPVEEVKVCLLVHFHMANKDIPETGMSQGNLQKNNL